MFTHFFKQIIFECMSCSSVWHYEPNSPSSASAEKYSTSYTIYTLYTLYIYECIKAHAIIKQVSEWVSCPGQVLSALGVSVPLDTSQLLLSALFPVFLVCNWSSSPPPLQQESSTQPCEGPIQQGFLSCPHGQPASLVTAVFCLVGQKALMEWGPRRAAMRTSALQTELRLPNGAIRRN